MIWLQKIVAWIFRTQPSPVGGFVRLTDAQEKRLVKVETRLDDCEDDRRELHAKLMECQTDVRSRIDALETLTSR